MPQKASLQSQEPSNAIDLLWGDCDLDALWNETAEELQPYWDNRLAA